MSADAVQQDEEFNGMTDIYLFPFISSGDITSSSVTSQSYTNLADFTAFDKTSFNGKVYSDVNLSVGVNKFLFYGATKEKGNGDLKASYLKMAHKDGWTEGDWAPDPILTTSTANDIRFDLVPIQRLKTLADVRTAGANVIAPVNAVDVALTTQIGTAPEGGAAKAKLQEIQDSLRSKQADNSYKAYTGSSRSIQELMTMIYATVKNLETAVLTEETANYATPIVTALSTYFTLSGNGTADNPYKVAWPSDTDFPGTTLGVPDGAVAIQYVAESTNAFVYVEPSVDGLKVPSISNYTYPPCLYYTANTNAMVKAEEYLASSTDDSWTNVKTNGNYVQGAITPTTRSVIMEDQVQYAVGRLDVQVRVRPATTIEDNSVDKDGNDAPQPVTVPGGGYKLTGVLIGGQKQVGWDFKPISGATEMTIWDNTTTSNIYAKQTNEDFSAINHTLALETIEASGTETGAVNIALEFENTGNDFCGIDHQVIPTGTKFYLVAKLDPSTNTTYYQQDPESPYTSSTGDDALIKQVFKQDYVTTAKLTIGQNSLKHAYNVVPDLRSPKLEFGLSVDLKWRSGITFDVEFQ